MSSLSERGQGGKKHAERLRCGKQTKAEWWDIERLDQKVGCAVDGDCCHTKRAIQEWWKSARHELTLCNHEFLPYRVILRMCVPFHKRGPSELANASVNRHVQQPCSKHGELRIMRKWLMIRCRENRCEIVNISRANLQPRAMCRTSTSVRPSSKVGVMSTSANKRRKLLSVLCSSSSDEVKSHQGHVARLQ